MKFENYKVKDKFAIDISGDLLRSLGKRGSEKNAKKICFLIKENLLNLEK